MNTASIRALESQLRSAFAEEAQRAPEPAGLAERVHAASGRTRRRRQVRRVTLVAALAAAVTGIAVLPQLGGPTFHEDIAASASSARAAPLTAVDAVCAGQDRAVSEPDHLPSNLGAVTAAYTCGTATHNVPGQGTWSFREVHRVTGGLQATLRAYAVPDLKTSPGPMCPAILLVRHVLLLDVGGKVIAAREPSTTCRGPLKSAVTAFDAMTTEVVSSVRVSQWESPLSLASGCPLTSKDTIALMAGQQGSRPPAQPDVLPDVGQVTACVYTEDPGDSGALTTATRLTNAEYAQVRTLVGRATADPRCAATPHTRFVVLEGDRSMPWTEIALDGCGVDQARGALRAPAELQSLLVNALRHRIVVS